ncbi:MAG: hypothetical protein EOO43_05310 [Flavobacterium sp.]|nr:MAG: hypothetical protein EOO43_05310 [Flavobacterium sp.]
MLITTALCGVKLYNSTAWQCNETLATYWPLTLKENCTNPIVDWKITKFWCNDTGCEDGGWQALQYPLNGSILICCQPKCDTFDCYGSTMNNVSTGSLDITNDFGLTWVPYEALLPTCPGGQLRSCGYDNIPCPPDVKLEKFYFMQVYCISPTCPGELSLNRVTNVFDCQDSSCQGGNLAMKYFDDLKRWVCQTPDCALDEMVYYKNRWACDKNCLYCQQAQEQCAY